MPSQCCHFRVGILEQSGSEKTSGIRCALIRPLKSQEQLRLAPLTRGPTFKWQAQVLRGKGKVGSPATSGRRRNARSDLGLLSKRPPAVGTERHTKKSFAQVCNESNSKADARVSGSLLHSRTRSSDRSGFVDKDLDDFEMHVFRTVTVERKHEKCKFHHGVKTK